MTKVLAICAMLICVAFQSAFAADSACKRLTTPKTKWVGITTPGFTAVKLMIYVKAKEDPSQETRNAFYRFVMYAGADRIRLDSQGNIESVESCSRTITAANGVRYASEKTLFRVRARPIGVTDSEYILGTALILPNNIVQQQPRIDTILQSGEYYAGTWGMDGNIPTLSLHVAE